MIRTIEDLLTAAREKGRKRLVAAYAEDLHTIEAIYGAVNEGIVDATLLGDPDTISEVCDANGIDGNVFTVIPETSAPVAVEKAVRMVRDGQADILMKGLVPTDVYMRGILSKDFGLVAPGGVVSHIVVIKLPTYHKLLVVSDVAVIPYPTLQQKAAIVKYQVSTAHNFGIEKPKVACIAPSEQLLPSMVSSTDSALLAKMGDRGQFGDAYVDGPLALDVALFEEVAKLKKVQGSSVAGDADCLVFPNLDAANAFFKSATHLCNADLACILAGTKAPCVLTSRGDTSATKLNSIALASLCANV